MKTAHTEIIHPVLELENISYRVRTDEQTLDILTDCNLSLAAQQTVAIVGRSGSGKSTLLSIMAGLEKPSDGEVSLLGHSLRQLNEDQCAQIRAQQVGFVFQNFQLLSSMTALENILMPLELFQVDSAREKAFDALDKVGLSKRAHHLPAQLSGGEQQRVAIARAFVSTPTILFADEPTGNLDEHTAAQIQQLLFELNQTHQTTLVLVTHDMNYARQCQQVLQLQHGQLTPWPHS
ncbi:ABC transporter ATP-binding protein [Thiosulfatimonas sediminis]|uniref:ABC transporter ATP-binding protein n=1 Tax=Thiosulfatimonas sediminis TaxID=2675054 RepID=A0A6F8PWB0_9GAMM|nr:ABC transporter ATP-binding protein [Thiosulfatimonas sediminis]BBP46433.1 ABC transporter ATP-binding protein [Thiosulfatimonas sediminis]